MKMIISKLQGGLGNQLFQWAATRAYAEKYNTEYYFDITFFESQDLRRLQIDEFKNITLNITDGSVENYGPMMSRFTKNLNTPEYKPFSVNAVRDTFNYENDIWNFTYGNPPFDILVANGYWQSEKYFKSSEKTIRHELKLDLDIDLPFLNENNVSLHVRRSDYLSSKGYHPVQNISYYEDALDNIVDYDNLIIFSDDIDWCKQNFKFRNMIFMDNFSDIQDMYIMSQCRNNIIANSSFSWWGAWLNENPDKIVVAPSKWFGEHVDLNQSDIIPDKWIKI